MRTKWAGATANSPARGLRFIGANAMIQCKTPRCLVKGNSKLGKAIYSFSLQAGLTCPGKSALCVRFCYAGQGYFLQPNVQRAYKRNLRLTNRADFVDRMVREIHRVKPKVVRIHASGDFYSPEYARKWAEIARLCPSTRFFAYTRSWRVPEIRRELARMADLPNVRLWFSCDKDTGIPASWPERVRLAWMQTAEDDLPPRADLVFRIKKLRKKAAKRIGLALVCPVENGATGNRTDCGRCKLCWK